MSTVYLVPPGTDSAEGAAPGDYLLRKSDDGLYEVGSVGDGCTWLGSLKPELLPSLPDVQSPREAPDQVAVLPVVQGVETAARTRGG